MKKLTTILLSSILFASNSYSLSISDNPIIDSIDDIKNSLELKNTGSSSSFGLTNTNYSSGSELESIVEDNTKKGRNWKKNKRKRENKKKRKQMQEESKRIDNNQSVQNKVNIKEENIKNGINIINITNKSVSETRDEETLKNISQKSQDNFKKSLQEKLHIKESNFTEQNIQDVEKLIRGEIKNIFDENTYDGDVDFEKAIQDVLNIDILKEAIESTSDDINYFINNRQFKMLGNLHQQIMNGADNGNTVYNRFNINDNILNDYKNYYKQLIDFISTFFNKKLIDILEDDYSSGINQIKNIINNIYAELDNRERLEDIDDIMCFFIDDKIDSENDLQGNNVLKIIANLAIATHDCAQNAQYASLQLAFGQKLYIGNSIILTNNIMHEISKQFKIICDTFDIKIK